MTHKSIESIPGFIGWFTEDQVPPGAHTFGFWGARRVAAFDSVEAAHEVLNAVDGFPAAECDPIQEMQIDVFSYYEVKADVEGLHLQPHDVTKPVYELLDPRGRWSHMIVARMSRAFASREEAAALAEKLRSLGLQFEINEREEYLTPGMLCEEQMTVDQEVERRRANGGVVRRIAPPDGFLSILERYEV